MTNYITKTIKNGVEANIPVTSVNWQYGDVTIQSWAEASWVTTEQPSNPVAGSTYYDTTNNVLKIYDWTQWKEVWWEWWWGWDPVSTPWIYWDKEDWLISVSSDWTTWMTIADKNLWATEVYTKADPYSNSNWFVDYDKQFWFLYQWWRNFPFSWNSIITQAEQVSYSSAKPWIFIAYKWDWLTTPNNNLRWAVTNTYVARRWPCLPWWHVPSRADMTQLDTILQAIWRDWIYSDPFSWETNDGYILKFTPAPIINVSQNWTIDFATAKSGWWSTGWSYVQFWLSDYTSNYWYFYSDDDDSEWDPAGNYARDRSTWAAIRPFKNEWVQPTTTWEVLYQPS